MIMFVRLRKQFLRAKEGFLDLCHEHILGRRQQLLKRSLSETPSMVALSCEPPPYPAELLFKRFPTLEGLPPRN